MTSVAETVHVNAGAPCIDVCRYLSQGEIRAALPMLLDADHAISQGIPSALRGKLQEPASKVQGAIHSLMRREAAAKDGVSWQGAVWIWRRWIDRIRVALKRHKTKTADPNELSNFLRNCADTLESRAAAMLRMSGSIFAPPLALWHSAVVEESLFEGEGSEDLHVAIHLVPSDACATDEIRKVGPAFISNRVARGKALPQAQIQAAGTAGIRRLLADKHPDGWGRTQPHGSTSRAREYRCQSTQWDRQ